MALAKVVVLLGGGRQFPDDLIDFSVGLKLRKTKGEKVRESKGGVRGWG